MKKFKDWVNDVKPKWKPPEGFFKQSADEIAVGLKKASDSLKQAMSRLVFFMNREGCSGKNKGSELCKKLEHAKSKLQDLFK